LNVYTFLQKVFIMLKRVISWIEMIIWWTMSFFEWSIWNTLLHVTFQLSEEISSTDEAISTDPMIHCCRLIVIQVLETSSMRVSHVQRHIRITIVNTIQFLAIHELLDIVLNNRALCMCWILCSCSFTLNCISKGKNILKLIMLKSVRIDINQTLRISESCVNKILVGTTRGINVCMHKWFFKKFSSINIFESCNFFSDITFVDFYHFPAKHNINWSLVALVKGNFISIREFINEIIWSPILNFSVGGGSSVVSVLSHEWFIV